jgi:hypothetical protein
MRPRRRIAAQYPRIRGPCNPGRPRESDGRLDGGFFYIDAQMFMM